MISLGITDNYRKITRISNLHLAPETTMNSSNDDIQIIGEENSCENSIIYPDDENQPSGAECLARCKEFAEITDTDTALAMFYLQDTKWNLQKGLDKYFKATNNKKAKIVACFDVETLDNDERNSSKKQKTSDKSSDCSENHVESDISVEKINDEEENEEGHFKILSWNIDGLDKSNLESRTLGVVKKIEKENPDVIFLQEVIEYSEKMLSEHLALKYTFTSSNYNDNSNKPSPFGYYTLILTKNKTCSLKNKNVIWFDNSVMGRNLLKVDLNYLKNIKICAMTSHLESTAEFSKQRVDQLKRCLEEMLEQDNDSVVFFGGDLNLRDSELKAIGGLPEKIYDMWESTGSRKECLYTWDCLRNSNLKMNGKFKPRCRFDRLYYRPLIESKSKKSNGKKPELTLMPVYFELEGLEKLKCCGRFCSDHWAIQSYCQLESNIAI